jgi:hypothetical protein
MLIRFTPCLFTPKSIEWVANKDLPAGTFPDPGSPHLEAQK